MKFFTILFSFLMVTSCIKTREIPVISKLIFAPDSLGAGSLLINEYTPKGKVDTNEFGILGKWIEIYNPGNKDIELDSNFYLTDTLAWPDKFQIKDIGVKQIIKSKSFLIVWTDNCDTIASGKLIHTNFSLNSLGGDLGISIKNSKGQYIFLDAISYDDVSLIPKGTSFGRFPDGSEGIKQLSFRTPNSPNQL